MELKRFDGPMTHHLKCDREAFHAIADGHKKCEVRRDDRDFRVGDTLDLLETVNTGAEMRAGAPLEYTGGQLLKVITHVQRGYGLPDGLVVLSFDDLPSTQTLFGFNVVLDESLPAGTMEFRAAPAPADQVRYTWDQMRDYAFRYHKVRADANTDARDAARYRWLRDNGYEAEMLFSATDAAYMDSAIDAEMSATPPAAEA